MLIAGGLTLAATSANAQLTTAVTNALSGTTGNLTGGVLPTGSLTVPLPTVIQPPDPTAPSALSGLLTPPTSVVLPSLPATPGGVPGLPTTLPSLPSPPQPLGLNTIVVNGVPLGTAVTPEPQ
jgi:hypothetical protein